eukprot:m.27801 g.27801  ORF g.27801 m.27801 type:complete len:244 (-) comp15811_c1_seq1:376-1107(-)
MTDPKVWWESMPIVTKTLFGCSFGLTLAANFGVVPMMSLVFDSAMIWNKFQIWRLITCGFFFGKLGFPFLMTMYWLYSYSLRLEQGQFERRTADYVWAVTIIWLVLLVVAYVMSQMIIGQSLVTAIVYMWCSMNAETIVTFWFGMVFQAMYFPWVLLAFAVLTGGSGVPEIIGIFAGHVYFFLKIKYPRDFGGPCYVETPQFMHRLFPGDADRNAPSNFGSASEGARPAARHAWGGGGRRLGD